MQELLKEGRFFSDEEMKQRSPWMYHEYVGRYLTDYEVNQIVREQESSSWAMQLLEHVDHQILRCVI